MSRGRGQIARAGGKQSGPPASSADAEVVLLAAETLEAVGVGQPAIDLNMPVLAPTMLSEAGIADAKPLIAPLDRKDIAAVRQMAADLAPKLEALIRAVGPADAAVA